MYDIHRERNKVRVIGERRMRKLKEQIFLTIYLVYSFFVIIGTISSIMTGKYDGWFYFGLFVLFIGIYEIRRIWKDSNCTKEVTGCDNCVEEGQ